MLKFSEIFEFSKEKIRKIPILIEFEWFEWFGPSPIEPFNPGREQAYLQHRYASPDDPLRCHAARRLRVCGRVHVRPAPLHQEPREG